MPVTTFSSYWYYILNNVFFFTERLYTFGKTRTFLSSFCKTLKETLIYIFYAWIHVKSIYEKLQTKFLNDVILPWLTTQAAILRLTNEANSIYNLLNPILLIFKYYVYRSREKDILNIGVLIQNLIEIIKGNK